MSTYTITATVGSRSADAVVTLTNALPGDPLYRFAREANIRIVDIEAAIDQGTLHVSHRFRLVEDPEAEVRRLLDFLGLDFDPACLRFHESAGFVQTPSRWQVRQPVHARSVGRWKPYAAHLAPLLDGWLEAGA